MLLLRIHPREIEKEHWFTKNRYGYTYRYKHTHTSLCFRYITWIWYITYFWVILLKINLTNGHVQILNNFILIHTHTHTKLGFPGGSVIKNPLAMQETQEIWVWSLGLENPLEEAWQPTPVLLPGESHEQRSLVGYGPWGHRVTKSRTRLKWLNTHQKLLPD